MVDALAGAYGQWATRRWVCTTYSLGTIKRMTLEAGDHAETEEIELFNTNPSNYKHKGTYR